MLSISCKRFERKYSSCTGRSSENLSSSRAGAQEKKKDRVFPEFHRPLNVNVLFCRVFLNLTVYDQTQGTDAVFS
jgi:hypothetical protein